MKMGHGGECLHAGDSKCDDTDGDGDGSVGEVSSGPEQGREELFQKAIRMFSESAEMGHTDAQTALGQLYELSADDETAVKWYVAASSRGCSRARNLLAMMYFEGKGVPKLKEKAYELFKQAANGGDVCAMNNVAMCLEQGIGVDKDVACALQIYKTGADSGSAQSAYSYGYLLVQHAMASIVGSKVFPSSALVVTGRVQNSAESVRREHDLQEGTRHLRIALEKGVSEAGYQIARLYEQ
ncbi:SEL1L2, partial [Symbiodinium microadriaticum]